ncbi:hypothetical protein HAX54_024465 [Datura stramonium]|uniref:Uncharacterized protein n=1 Tax=Datura stramonium TaxID=4076 RepID=A0ABS8V0J8_DATST|nr:hypothetical protein [Datura stramonium]
MRSFNSSFKLFLTPIQLNILLQRPFGDFMLVNIPKRPGIHFPTESTGGANNIGLNSANVVFSSADEDNMRKKRKRPVALIVCNTVDRSITLHENIFECGNYDPILSREDNFDAILVDDVVDNILHMSEVEKDFNFEYTHSASKGNESLSFILAAVDLSGEISIERNYENTLIVDHLVMKEYCLLLLRNLQINFDARVNWEKEFCVDESVRRRGVSLNGDMEGYPKIFVDVVKCSERNECEEENLKVASSLVGDTFVVALKSKWRQRKNKSSKNDFELDLRISSLKTRKQRKKK